MNSAEKSRLEVGGEMILIIDGDNCPGRITDGICELKKKDKVILVFCENNQYYVNKTRMDRLRSETKAKIITKITSTGKNSTDFYMAIEATKLCENEDRIALISSDKHIWNVGRMLAEKFPNVRIICCKNICEYNHKLQQNAMMLSDSSGKKLRKILKKAYGKKQGERMYNAIFNSFNM